MISKAPPRYFSPYLRANLIAPSLASARVITARVWIVVRGVSAEVGIDDNTDYEPGDVDLGTYDDNFRRLMVSKTILLRNSRI